MPRTNAKCHPERPWCCKGMCEECYYKSPHAKSKCRKRKTPQHPDVRRALSYKLLYGITLEDYDRMFEAQGGVCAICGEPPGERKLHVDHKHGTKHIRGLLCGRCNIGIGQFRESEELMRKAIDYLAK